MARTVPDRLEDKLPAAAEVFATQGYDGARIEDLAEATGIPKATLYYYFDGKHEVLAHLLRRLLDLLAQHVREATAGDGDARERLERVVGAQFEVMRSHRTECLVLLAELGRAGRLPEIAERIRAAFHEPIEVLLTDGAADGSLRRVADVELAAAALFGAVTMSALKKLLDGQDLTGDQATALVAMMLDGLRP